MADDELERLRAENEALRAEMERRQTIAYQEPVPLAEQPRPPQPGEVAGDFDVVW